MVLQILLFLLTTTKTKLEATKLGTHMNLDKKIFQGGKTKLINENLIFLQGDFVCWSNLHLNMPDHLNPFTSSGNKKSYILQQTCSF